MVQYGYNMREKAVIHLQEVERDYPGLILKSCEGGFATYNGTITFTANYDNLGLIDDEFEVELVFPLTDSDNVPTAKETGGRIPRDIDFHVYPDGTMCLVRLSKSGESTKKTPPYVISLIVW